MKNTKLLIVPHRPLAAILAVLLAGSTLHAQTVDMNTPLKTSQGQPTTLAGVLGDNRALLLDFWASRCGPCIRLMPALKAKHEKLAAHGIAVAGINTENDPSVAEEVREALKLPAGDWLVEPSSEPFSKPLGIDSIPRMILLDSSGRVLYNGHPNDPALQKALQEIDPSIS